MKFASAITMTPGLDGLRELQIHCLAELGDGNLDLGVLFFDPTYSSDVEAFARELEAAGLTSLIGTTGRGIVEKAGECEAGPAASLLLGRLPGCYVETFHARADQLAGEPDHRIFGLPRDSGRAAIVLSDIYCARDLLRNLERHQPRITAVGGLASGGAHPDAHCLLRQGALYSDGAVGAVIAGNIDCVTVVSQGCKPFGRRAAVTEVKEHYLISLRGKPAVDVLKEEISSLTDDDHERVHNALHLGVVMDETQKSFGRGDFLIRNILGIIPQVRYLAVDERLRMGQTVQFHLRDPGAAEEDLRELLGAAVAQCAEQPPAAGLLFSCIARGRAFFGKADHDLGLVREQLGALPLAGFFCNGEIGPVAGKHYLHGYTSVLCLLRPKKQGGAQ